MPDTDFPAGTDPDVIRFVTVSREMRDTVSPIVTGQVTDPDDVEAFLGRAMHTMAKMAQVASETAGNPEHDALAGLALVEQMCDTMSTAYTTMTNLLMTAKLNRLMVELGKDVG